MIELQDIINRLGCFGYIYQENDIYTLKHIQAKKEHYIKHFCNISIIPECLKFDLIDAICSEFLGTKRATGTLTDIQLEGIVKIIRDGDTEVQYTSNNSLDAETLFKDFLKSLELKEEVLISHRCLKW